MICGSIVSVTVCFIRRTESPTARTVVIRHIDLVTGVFVNPLMGVSWGMLCIVMKAISLIDQSRVRLSCRNIIRRKN